MQIVLDSKNVLQILYNTLEDDSYCLLLDFKTKEVADKLNMSRKHFNLCLCYLKSCGYLEGDLLFNHEEDSNTKVSLTASAINYCENNKL